MSAKRTQKDFFESFEMKSFVKELEKIISHQTTAIIILFFLYFGYRLVLLHLDSFPFNADEAIVGLMGKHILEGGRPLFFYGQSYMGSLDAYLVALSFLIFGIKVDAIRYLQILLYFLTILVLYSYVIIAFQDRVMAFLGAVCLIFAPVNVVLYTSVSLGGYGEAFLIGSLVLLISVHIFRLLESANTEGRKLWLAFLAAGLLCGLGLWVNAISLTICVPPVLAGLYAYVKKGPGWRQVFKPILILAGGFLAASVLWWYPLLFRSNGSVLSELVGSAVSVEQGGLLQIIWQHLISFVLFGPTVILGLRPPWSTGLTGGFLVLIVIVFWILVFAVYLTQRKQIPDRLKFVFGSAFGIMGAVFLGFLLTSFGIDPSGRYFLPFVIPLALFAAFALRKLGNRWFYAFFVGVLIYQLYSVVSLAKTEPYLTTQFYELAQVNHQRMDDLITFLHENNETTGFSNYWVSYPLAFRSNEEIISVPALPYHPDLRYAPRDNRIVAYSEKIQGQKRYFYITTNNAALDRLLADKLNAMQVAYDYHEIDDYHIYYNLSEPITPETLGIHE